jgi:hypothetical protein
MITPEVVNIIWPVLEEAKDVFMAKHGEERIKVGQIVDFVIYYTTARVQYLSATYVISRQAVTEAWLYQALEMVARDAGVEPLPPVAQEPEPVLPPTLPRGDYPGEQVASFTGLADMDRRLPG